jgi:hypothetical protein
VHEPEHLDQQVDLAADFRFLDHVVEDTCAEPTEINTIALNHSVPKAQHGKFLGDTSCSYSCYQRIVALGVSTVFGQRLRSQPNWSFRFYKANLPKLKRLNHKVDLNADLRPAHVPWRPHKPTRVLAISMQISSTFNGCLVDAGTKRLEPKATMEQKDKYVTNSCTYSPTTSLR